jgi:hypothetical protein
VTGLSFEVTTTSKKLLLVLDIDSGADPAHTVGLTLTLTNYWTYITASNASVASTNFPLANSSDKSLPVELSAFTAEPTPDGVRLKWRTESEFNNIGFSIYRSEVEGGKYIRITFVNSAGNTGMPTDYQFIDQNTEAGKTYSYYLEDIDIQGEKNKSKTIKVVVVPPAKLVPTPIPKEFRLLQNYPNPFNPETWIPYQLPSDAQVRIHIYNIQGKLVRIMDLGKKATGVYISKDKAAYWDGRDSVGERVSSGIYFYWLSAGDFSATHRMAIVK